jgi:cytidine deaminase
MSPDDLVRRAKEARSRAYCPYSRYPVGAAILTADGTIYVGTNVENASYGLTVCAERVALSSAVADGHRRFQALAVVTEDGAACCGACRQVLREFAETLPIHLAQPDGTVTHTSLEELLPHPFGPASLDRDRSPE